MSRIAAWLAVVALASAGRAARASSLPATIGDGGTFLLAGANLGLVLEDGDQSLLVGVEVSVARANLESGFWYGTNVDVVRDTQRNATRFGGGFEIGLWTLGIDADAIIERDDGETRAGMRVRLALTLGALTVCGGPVIRFNGPDADRYGTEISVLAKFPFNLGD